MRDSDWLIVAIFATLAITVFGFWWKRTIPSPRSERVLKVVAIYVGLSIYACARILPSYLSPRAAVVGHVVASEVHAYRASDHSYLTIETAPTSFVRINASRDVVTRVMTNDSVRVTYLTWNSDPLTIEILNGDHAGFVLNRPSGGKFSAVGFLLVFVVYGAFGLYALPLSSDAKDSKK